MKPIVIILSRILILIGVPLGITLFFTLFEAGKDLDCIFEKVTHFRDKEKSSWSCLHFAATKGDSTRVLSILSEGANIEVKSNQGKTPLYEAAKSGNAEIVRLLIDNGALIITKSANAEFTPLHVAAEYNHHNVVNVLLDMNAPININNRWMQTPLSQASWKFADPEMITLLIQRGANVNTQDNKGYTPLHKSAGRNKIAILSSLIANGADLDIKTNGGYTALMYASYKGMAEAVKILLDAGAAIEKTPGSNSAMHQAKRNGHQEIVYLLIEYGAIDTKKVLLEIKSGFEKYKSGQYAQAVQEFSRIIDTDPANYQAYYYRGRSYEKLNETIPAIEDLLKTEKISPGFRDTNEVIGWLYLKMENYDKSLKHYSKAIKNDPSNAVAFHNRARLLYQQGEIEQAMYDIKTACDLGYQAACKVQNKFKW